MFRPLAPRAASPSRGQKKTGPARLRVLRGSKGTGWPSQRGSMFRVTGYETLTGYDHSSVLRDDRKYLILLRSFRLAGAVELPHVGHSRSFCTKRAAI